MFRKYYSIIVIILFRFGSYFHGLSVKESNFDIQYGRKVIFIWVSLWMVLVLWSRNPIGIKSYMFMYRLQVSVITKYIAPTACIFNSSQHFPKINRIICNTYCYPEFTIIIPTRVREFAMGLTVLVVLSPFKLSDSIN